MSKTRLIATIIVATLVGTSMVGIRHIRNLNNQIEFKQIELKDNSVKLKLLDKKYEDLNKDLEETGSDKAKIEKELKQLQKERDELNKALQAKLEKKKRDIAVKAQKAITAPVRSPKAYASSCTSAKSCIYHKESGNRTNAINKSSGACGIGQAWPCSKMKCSLSDYACQDKFFTAYAVNRYGSWDKAWAFWQANNWW